MRKLAYTLAAAASLALLAPVSVADTASDKFEAAFTFNRADSAETTYSNFMVSAKDACSKEARSLRPIKRVTYMRTCMDELLDGAVMATHMPSLIALREDNEDRSY